jgi:hypothetical protein
MGEKHATGESELSLSRPELFTPWKDTLVLTEYVGDWPEWATQPVWTILDEREFLFLSGFGPRFLGSSTRYPVTIMTELPQLR